MQTRLFPQALLLVIAFVVSLSVSASDDVLAPSEMPADVQKGVVTKTPAKQPQAEKISHVTTRLLADTKAIAPGVPFKLGVEFITDPHWHIYYKESGDAGMPTQIAWMLPPGFQASELEWEKPTKFSDSGIVTYGYEGTTVIAATITPPAQLPANTPVTFSANVKWLACKDLCLPGKTQLSSTLPAVQPGAFPEADNVAAFSKLGFKGPVGLIKSDANLVIQPVSRVEVADTDASKKDRASKVDTAQMAIDDPPPVVIPVSQADSAQAATAGTAADATSGGKSILDENLAIEGNSDSNNLAYILLLAFVGGFILNFMPCVLPVISIKVLSFMQQAGEDPERVFQLGLTFTAGIVSSFMVLALIIVALQQAGQSVGWGFQFQYPIFVLSMACIILFFALSMFGIFYIQVTAGQAQVDKLASKEGLAGTFFKGVLATILSTPCTAPALGTALGFAFTQPWWLICLVFFTIAVGMSFPYIVLTANPGWMKFIPKPGVWMEKFKEGMGFLMLATAVWLLYVLTRSVGVAAGLSAAGFLVVLSFAVWVVGKFTDLTSTGKRKAIVYAIAIGIIGLGARFLLMPYPQLLATNFSSAGQKGRPKGPVPYAVTVPEPGDGITWEPFTIDTLDKYLAEGKTVFLDFTADWCLTCKVNELQVISTPPVIDKFKSLNVVTMKADWTREDDQIAALLKKFGRSGVPLYVIFPAGRPTQPIVLPEVITQQIVLDNLDKAGASK
jgi:thiol:disulfide interchange protein DsbD